MPFETLGETQFNVGKAQAGLSREGGFGLTTEDRLRISRAAVENMIGGTIEKNKKKLVPAKPDDEIAELTQIVLKAANGESLETSITEQKRREQLMKPFMQELLTNMLNQDNPETSENDETTETTE